jgi:hypothetical protein
MKKHYFLICLLAHFQLAAQNISVSEEVYVGDSEGYGIIGKLNDRLLFFHLNDNLVKLRALDNSMHKIWDKEIEPDRKNHAKVLEVVGNRQDFNVIYQYTRKNQNFIKIHKYDGQAKLLDSVTICRWDKDFVAPKLEVLLSEDKKSLLVYEVIEHKEFKALAINLDSMRTIWEKSLAVKNWDFESDRYEQIIFTNNADLYLIQEEDNRVGSEKHRFHAYFFGQGKPERDFDIPVAQVASPNMKFSYDNQHQKLVAVGLYSTKTLNRVQGIFSFSIPPQYQSGQTVDIKSLVFDDELMSTMTGKKINESKGLQDLEIRDIIHRRDGGFLVVVEQTRYIERRTSNPIGRITNRFGANLLAMDYYHDNVFVMSFTPNGTQQWKTVFFKKQVSQDDEGRYSSYFLAKTTASLRFLFNDAIERSTIVSEYVLNGKGEGERHAIMNTDGQDLYLRLRDALQISANEVIVPSDDRRRVKLVKIQY